MSDFEQPQPPPVNPYDSPETVRPGMSSGAKVLLGLGIGCGVLVLLCCGVFGVTAFYFGRSFQRAMSTDVETIREVTDGIVTIEVPPELKPKFSLDWSMPFVGRKMMSMAAYVDKREQSGLVLFQIAADLGDPGALKTQMEDSLRESGHEGLNEVRVEEPETFETEINGSPAEFTVGRGKREDKDLEVWQATGAFDGNGGPALLLMQLDAEEFDKDQLMDVLKSMK